MARQATQSVQNNFTKGLITTASGLNFPEQAVTETYDCIFDLNGSVSRRKGFDLEPNHSEFISITENAVKNLYLWKDVGGDGRVTLLVAQIGSVLFFYNASTTDPISAHKLSGFVDLTDFSPSGAPDPSTSMCQFTAGNGLLFVAHPWLESFYVEYDISTDTFTTTEVALTVRDFKGMEDATPINTRPTVGLGGVTTTHHYNLLNQGWSETNLTTWDTARTDLPSDSDVMFRFKNSSDAFDTATVPNVISGNSPAPKGHFILNVYDEDRQTASTEFIGGGGLSIPVVSTGYQRVSNIAFFAGRVFYSGINFQGYNSNIYFTQIVERPSQYGQCYQANDPTAEDLFDLLPTDGGVIVIQDAGTIVKMISGVGGLLVFCTNGIWQISGSTGLGFTANDYSVTKISSVRCLTAPSFVDVAGTIMFWNLDGIYAISPNSTTGVQVSSISDGTIREFFHDIPPSSKRFAKGYYNPITGIVQWLYKSTDSGDVTELFQYDRILNFNVFTKAFYPWTVSTNDSGVFIHDLVVIESLGGEVTLEDVTNNALATVTANDTTDVQVYTINEGIVIPKFKYFTSYNNGFDQFTFSEENDFNGYLDWATIDTGVEYDSYFISGYIIRGQANKKFQPTWINLYADTTVPTQYSFQGLWDYAINSNSNRFTTVQNISINDSDFKNGIRRLKVRGNGKVLQYKVASINDNPFTLVGWSTFETVNSIP